ncbi:MAG: site-specific DNA-methyltransferase [Chlorobiota bacterium]|jgi:site-specific DNA-methyltransferase (adenine-specific)|nr:MAG: site-specific DNA-methyltransferase [Chlorobiota bacterium]
MGGTIIFADNLDALRAIESGSIDLIYIDPPFNTGRPQKRTTIKVHATQDGERVGFGDRRYRATVLGTRAFQDVFDDYLGFLRPRLEEAHRVLASHGSLYFHIDYRWAHYCKILLDSIFGMEAFINEIIWAYDYGGRSKRRWPAKHDTIFFYAKDPNCYYFNEEAVERIPYMAPGLVGAEKAARGKFPTDVWWHTIVPTNSKEKTGYPTQKPLGILRRIISASSKEGDTVLDFFAGSGTTGVAAAELGRNFVLVDNNLEALAVMAHRFANIPDVTWVNFEPELHRESSKQHVLFDPPYAKPIK